MPMATVSRQLFIPVVSSNNGCVATASVTITQPPVLTATMGGATNVPGLRCCCNIWFCYSYCRWRHRS